MSGALAERATVATTPDTTIADLVASGPPLTERTRGHLARLLRDTS